MSKLRIPFRCLFFVLFSFSANSYFLIANDIRWIFAAVPSFLLTLFLTGFYDTTVKRARYKFLNHGTECLIIFAFSLIISAVYHIVLVALFWKEFKIYLLSALVCYIAHFLIFWCGIICVYVTSVQLGIKERVIGAVLGPIPIAHFFGLSRIIKICLKEVKFETKKDIINRSREKDKICKTKYPILFVHGVFFRDSNKLNYWGRVPAELIRNGAEIYYGNHQSALSVEKSGRELYDRIQEIIEKTGCEKVNIVAHSKGGLDARYALAKLGAEPMVASLTTINTPHRGCNFADHLLSSISADVQRKAAAAYNGAAKVLGDTEPDFMAAVKDLTASACAAYDKDLTVPEGVYCQSIGSVLKKRTGGKFPLNISYPMVKKFDGENDGLVSVDSFSFGESCRILKNEKDRGISHGDMIDLNRENIDGFDVREFYVELISDLKSRGL